MNCELYYEYLVCLFKAQSLSEKMNKHFEKIAAKGLNVSDNVSLDYTQKYDALNMRILELKKMINAEKTVFSGF